MPEQIGFHNGAGSARRQLICAFWKWNDTHALLSKEKFWNIKYRICYLQYHRSWIQTSVQSNDLPVSLSMMLLCSSNLGQQLISLDGKSHSTTRKMFQCDVLNLINQHLNLREGSCLQFCRNTLFYIGGHISDQGVYFESIPKVVPMCKKSQTLIS